MRIIPKLQNTWTTLLADNTRVLKPMVMYPVKRVLKPGEQFFDNNGKTIIVSPRLEYVYQDNRDSKIQELSHKESVKKRKEELLKKAQEHTTKVFGNMLEESTLVPTFERITGEELTPGAKFAASFVLPTATFKGMLLVGKGLNYAGKAANYVARMGMPALGYAPSTLYYFKPGYIGMNGSAIINKKIFPKDLANRKFFSIEEYGSNPIYSKELAEQLIKNRLLRFKERDNPNPGLDEDITYYEENVGIPANERESTMKIAMRRLQNWKNSAHGRIMEQSMDSDLSTASYEQVLGFAANRHKAGEGILYPVNRKARVMGTNDLEGVLKPGYILLNGEGENVGIKASKEYVDRLNKEIIHPINEKYGLNLPDAIYEERHPIMVGDKIIGYSNHPRVFAPAFGLFKLKRGNKI